MAGYVDKVAACTVAECKMRKFVKCGTASGKTAGCKIHCKKPEKGVREAYDIVVAAIASSGANANDIQIFQEMPINTSSASSGRKRKGKHSRVDLVVANASGDMLGIEVNGSKEHEHDPLVRKRDGSKYKAWCDLDNAADFFIVPCRQQGSKQLRKGAWLQMFSDDLTAAVRRLCASAL